MKKEVKYHTMGVRVTESEWERLNLLAQKDSRTVSSLVRKWIMEGMKKEGKK